MYFGAGTPPREAPQGLWREAHTARQRPPGTHAIGQRSKEVYKYIQLHKVYSIQGTVYRVQGTSILGPVYRVLGYIPSIQGTRVYTQYTVYSIQSTRV